MANKSGTSEQIIGIPKGGGAISGLGESFSPDLHTGTGNFSVPISVPPGRNGFQPQLNLFYSTGNGNSPFGLGWQLSIPGVSRKTNKGLPRYQGEDTFLLSGAEDLIPVESEDNWIQYRPRTEGLFAIITHFIDSDPRQDYWQVKSKDGLQSFYGNHPNSSEADAPLIYDPDNPTHIFDWKLKETRDPFGNRIRYHYDRVQHPEQNGEEPERRWSQLYLSRIEYADYGENEFLVEVVFEYEDREDAFSVYRSGFEIRTTRRCRRISVFTHADQRRLVKTYNLNYEYAPLSRHSLLTEVEVIGHDEGVSDGQARTEELPPITFRYTTFDPDGKDFVPVEGRELPVQSLANPDTDLIDLFGNGMPDILQMNGVIRYWENLGNGRFGLPKLMEQGPAGLTLADPDVQFMDANGEGKADLVVNRPGLSGYFPTQFHAEWDMRSFQKYPIAPSFNLYDPNVKLVDLDGDGVTDALRAGTRMECFFQDPDQGWQETRFVERGALEGFPNINFTDSRVRLADLTGDGLQDMVMIYDGNVEYWPYMGYGKWGRRLHMRNSPRFPRNYDPRRILLGDIAGDGLADLIYVDDNKVTLWINQNGNGFSDPIEIRGTPSFSDIDAVRLVDLYGSGVSGILYSSDQYANHRDHYYFLDLTGGIKPYLLHEMNNNLGAITRVEYRPSTYYYNQDAEHHDTRWKTPLPFPVQVVACVEVIDQISHGKMTTEYRYHHGYWDGGEREFRGFGRVEQVDTQTFEQFNSEGLHEGMAFEGVQERHYTPPLLTKTWFHQGPVGPGHGDWTELDYSDEFWQGDTSLLGAFSQYEEFLSQLPVRRARRDAIRALRGSVLRTELYALDGTEYEERPYTVAESIFGIRTEFEPEDSPARGISGFIFFPYALASRTTQWERGNDPMTQFSFTRNYDPFGQAREQIAVACPRGWRNIADLISNDDPFLATYSQSDFAYSQGQDDFRQSALAEPYIKNRSARASSYEVLHQGDQTLEGILAAVDQPSTLSLIGQSLTYYDGEAFMGLPFGQIGAYGAAVRTESLVLTEAIAQASFQPIGEDAMGGVPTYLYPNGNQTWTEEYPAHFQEHMPELGGYTFHDGTGPQTRGYFVQSARVRFDFHDLPHGRGLPLTNRDPLGRDIQVRYDDYDLLPVQVTTPLGLTTQAIYDYRVLQPRMVIDPNENRTTFVFTPLGMLAATAVMGKEDESLGDTLEVPGTRIEYDLLAYVERQQPVSVRSIVREHHVQDAHIPLPQRDDTIETVEYSDGFGRLLQTRTQAEEVYFGDTVFSNNANLPADQDDLVGNAIGQVHQGTEQRVVVSGWQVYDNKGQVVLKYEPFFDEGWDYHPPEEEQLGQAAEMFYDPRGQVIRTLNPDGSEQQVIYGVPVALNMPELFDPTPWEAYTYDANDLASVSHITSAEGQEISLSDRAPEAHWFTPASILIDALGRTTRAVERNREIPRQGESMPPIEEYITRSTYDIRGNLLTVTDALGRLAFQYAYDLANQGLRTDSIDAGTKYSVLDVLGNPVETRDSKGALLLSAYDELNRPTHLWASDGTGQALPLRQRLRYAEEESLPLSSAEILNRNLRGQLLYHYDEAGLLSVQAFDFKGNLLEKTRQVISDDAILSIFSNIPAGNQIPAFQIDWDPPAGSSLEAHAANLLESEAYTTSSQYDALNRATQLQYPLDAEGERKILRPQYNRAGALERVELTAPNTPGTSIAGVEHIAYNAKGQRTLIAYANGLMTRYAYDPLTFRLLRLHSQRYTRQAGVPYTFETSGGLLQDLAYTYDLTGNILSISDRTQGSGIPNTLEGLNALTRRFEYDALYRLTFATGREHDRAQPSFPWEEAPRTQDHTLTRAYTERYQYDPMGNMLALLHRWGSNGFTRNFAHEDQSNRLRALEIGNGQPLHFQYAYDATGNMTQEGTTRHFEWNHSNQLRAFRNQVAGTAASVHATYLYDAGGQRTKKLVRRQNGRLNITLYIDGVFEVQRELNGGTTQQNSLLHLMDDQQRIAILRVGSPFPDDETPALKYHIGDHLGSSHITISENGAWVNREEYSPYGQASFGGYAFKRYRYAGKEKDGESGLLYYGMRYYFSWLGRWSCPDFIGPADSVNVYLFSKSNPINFTDSIGLLASPTDQSTSNVESNSDLGGVESSGSFCRSLPAVGPKSDIYDTQPKMGDYNDSLSFYNAQQDWMLNSGYYRTTVRHERTPPKQQSWWDKGGGTMVKGLALVAVGAIGLATGGSGWILLGSALSISGGIPIATLGAHQIGGNIAGNITAKGNEDINEVGDITASLSSPAGLSFGTVGVALGGKEGLKNGASIGNALEGGFSIGVGVGRANSQWRFFQQLRKGKTPPENYGWTTHTRKMTYRALGIPANSSLSASHWIPRRFLARIYLKKRDFHLGNYFGNSPLNVKPLPESVHDWVDFGRSAPATQGKSLLYKYSSLPFRISRAAPDWAQVFGYGLGSVATHQ